MPGNGRSTPTARHSLAPFLLIACTIRPKHGHRQNEEKPMKRGSRWMSWVVSESADNLPALPWERHVRHVQRTAVPFDRAANG